MDDGAGCVGGKDNYGDGGGGRFGLEFAEYLVSMHVGQVQVEQDEVGDIPGGAFDAVPPDASDLSLMFGLPLRNRDTSSTFAGLSSM